MNNFLDELFSYCEEKETFRHTASYCKDASALCAMEEQIEAAMGENFWEQYIRTSLQCTKRENVFAFQLGLRFGVELMRSIG